MQSRAEDNVLPIFVSQLIICLCKDRFTVEEGHRK